VFFLSHPNYADLMTLDHNAYWVNGTGTLLAYNGSADITELPILTGKDENSISSEVLFTNIAIANLHTGTADVNAKALLYPVSQPISMAIPVIRYSLIWGQMSLQSQSLLTPWSIWI